jgi:O-antigen/teichoic acid export membrane protein
MSSRRRGEQHTQTAPTPDESETQRPLSRKERRRAKAVEKAAKKAAREAKKAGKKGRGTQVRSDEEARAAARERAANAEREDLKDPGARGRWARARQARKARTKKSKHEERVNKPHKQSRITKGISDWWGRLLGAASDKTFAGQEEQYASHKTTRDYIWNTVGVGAWGGVFPLLTIVVTQLTDAEIAGMFSLAFVTGMLLMYIGNYGVRTYQVSDINETHSFSDYQVNRYLTCAIMILIGVGYCTLRGYGALMFTMSVGIYVYKMVDALADVYEGRLQQYDKMYLAGISQTFRSVFVFIVFTIVLAITRDVGIASVAMGVTAVVTFLILTFPLALFETPKSERFTLSGVGDLFKQCFPLFLALFLYALIDNMPKFVMEGVLSYDNQLYFNALYFPAQFILLTVGVIYKPLLLRLANLWADPKGRRKFDLAIFAMMAITVAITVVLGLFMGWIGLDIMSFLYGLDFNQYEGLCYIMLAAGAVTAIIDFLYQAITVLRRQRAVMKLYVITFGFSLFVPTLLINFTGLPGAIIGYLIVMSILLVLLIMEYISIRLEFKYAEANGTPIAPVTPTDGRATTSAGQSVASQAQAVGANAVNAANAATATAPADGGNTATAQPPRRQVAPAAAQRQASAASQRKTTAASRRPSSAAAQRQAATPAQHQAAAGTRQPAGTAKTKRQQAKTASRANAASASGAATTRASRRAHARAMTQEAFDRGRRVEQNRQQQARGRYVQSTPQGAGTAARPTSAGTRHTGEAPNEAAMSRPINRNPKSHMSHVRSAALVDGHDAGVHMKQRNARRQVGQGQRSQTQNSSAAAGRSQDARARRNTASPEVQNAGTSAPQDRRRESKIPTIDLQEMQRREVDESLRAHADERDKDGGRGKNR